MELTSTNEPAIEETSENYPGYNIYLHYVLVFIFLLYIPIILFSSSLVISAVIYLKKLHHTQHYIILSISLMDVFIAVVIMPERLLLEIPPTRESIYSNKLLTYLLLRFLTSVNVIYVQFLVLLGLDTFLQVKYPIAYWKHNSVNSKKIVIVMITGIIIINLLALFIVTGVQIDELSDPLKGHEIQVSFYNTFGLIWACFFLLSVLLIVCVASLRCNKVCGAAERGTIIFLIAYILYFLPTILLDLTGLNKDQDKHMWDVIGRRARYLPSVTNGLIIYLSRPIYRTAFRFFIGRRPTQWKHIQRFFTEQKETAVSNPNTVHKTPDNIKEQTNSPSHSGEMSHSVGSECFSNDNGISVNPSDLEMLKKHESTTIKSQD